MESDLRMDPETHRLLFLGADNSSDLQDLTGFAPAGDAMGDADRVDLVPFWRLWSSPSATAHDARCSHSHQPAAEKRISFACNREL